MTAFQKCPVVVAITPQSRANMPPTNYRLDAIAGTSGLYGVTIHETGNERPGTGARSHSTWQDTGEDAIDNAVAVHFYVDSTVIVQKLQLDRMGYHAADNLQGVGGRSTIAIEKCVNSDDDEDLANEHLAELVARLAAGDDAFDWGGGHTRGKISLQHLYQHVWVSFEKPPHDCPQHIRREGKWDWLMGRIDWYAAQVKVKPAVKPRKWGTRRPVPGPRQTKTINGKTFVLTPKRVKTIRTTPVLEFADPQARPLRSPLETGTIINVEYTVVGSDHEPWFVNRFGARMLASNFTE